MNIPVLLKHIYDSRNIPLTLFEEQETLTFGASFDRAIMEKLKSELFAFGTNPSILATEDYMLCGAVNYDDGCIFIGPVMEFPCNVKTARNILVHYKESYTKNKMILDYFNATPEIGLGKLIKHVRLINYSVRGVEAEDFYSAVTFKANDKVQDNKDAGIMHNSEKVEQMILAIIEFGKTVQLSDFFNDVHNMNANMGVMANDSLRAFRNMVVTSTTLASRAAVKGGLDYETAMNLSDMYIRKSETLNTWNDIQALWRRILIDYTARIEKIRRLNPDSLIAREICNYCINHVYEPLGEKDVAEALHYNTVYICRRFKENTGKRLSDYINELKIEESKRLLIGTDMSLSDITYAIGFSSQSYFQTVFKKITGVTPMVYRKG